MAADVTIVDDASNSVTLTVDTIAYNFSRQAKEFALKSLPSLGAPSTIGVDFGAYTETLNLTGVITTRAAVETLYGYVQNEWFVNSPLVVTIPALDAQDEAMTVALASGTEPVCTSCKIKSDINADGVSIWRFDMTFGIVLRL